MAYEWRGISPPDSFYRDEPPTCDTCGQPDDTVRYEGAVCRSCERVARLGADPEPEGQLQRFRATLDGRHLTPAQRAHWTAALEAGIVASVDYGIIVEGRDPFKRAGDIAHLRTHYHLTGATND